jgi:CHAT domain-containing protein
MKFHGVLLASAFFCVGVIKAQAVPAEPGPGNAAVRRAGILESQAVALRKGETKKDLAAARVLFEESARLFELGHSPERAAEAHLGAAEISIVVSQYRHALQAYREAIRLGHEDARCTAMSRIAQTYATTGPLGMADRSSNDALQFCRGRGQRGEAQALEARGEALEAAGAHAESAQLFERAAESFGAIGDGNAQAGSLLMLAAALYSDGKQEQGFAAAGHSLQLWTSLNDQYGIARIRAALGIFALARGEFETAQCNYQIAEPAFRRLGNRDEEASVLNGLGYASREIGEPEKSLKFYQRARLVFASIQDSLGEHEAITGLGKALFRMKRYKELPPLYSAELRLAYRSSDAALIASSLGDMAALYEAEEKYDLAERFYGRALSKYRNAKHLYGEGDILISLGRLQELRGRHLQALELLNQAQELKEKTGQIEEEAEIQYEKCRVLMRLQRLDEAKNSIEKAIEMVERQRGAISQFDTRASYFASVHRYYALYIDLLMQLHFQNPDLGFAKRAFEASEKSKVRSLLDLLTTSAQDASCSELLAKQLDVRPVPNVAEPTAELANAVMGPTMTLEQAQAELESDTILLEYALGEERSFVWAVSRNGMASYELPKSSRLRRLVTLMRTTLLPPPLEKTESVSDYQARVHEMDRKYESASKELSRLVLGPIHLEKFKRALIVPDGVLQYIPFAALPAPSRDARGEPLIVRCEVDLLPSVTVLENIRKAAQRRTRPRADVAIFADPVFEQDDPRVLGHRSLQTALTNERLTSLSRAIRDTGGEKYIARLPASRDEANAIARTFRARGSESVQLALDFDANRDSVLKNGLSQFRLIHFATHGVVDARHPELSGLILSLVDPRGRMQDGYLRIGDINHLKLAADLVVLSSCDSALGKDLQSEGIIGLPRAFLYAGAKSVIASSWKVDDEATAKLMAILYTRIRSGEGIGSALRGAQMEMLRDPRSAKPYYWAAFAAQGEYRPAID